jgi:hypothetical protein
LEVGETGTPHIQGYIYFKQPKAFSVIKEAYPTAHIEMQAGTAAENKAYCTKKDGRIAGPWEFGEEPRAGERNDLQDIKQKLDSGVSLAQISQEHFGSYLRYSRGFKEYLLLNAPVRDWEMDVCVYWGPSGAGKSRSLFAEHKGAFWKTKNSGQMQFWDGYNGEDTVIIDEFYGWLPYDFLLRLCDRYPMSLEIKHGTLPVAIRKVYFSSNKHPKDWYNYERMGVPSWGTYQADGTPYNPLERRIKRIVQFHGTGGPDESAVPPVVRITTGSAYDT